MSTEPATGPEDLELCAAQWHGCYRLVLSARESRLGLVAGARYPAQVTQPAPIPSGTVTLLFTDVQGSTRLWEAEPGPMGNRAAPP